MFANCQLMGLDLAFPDVCKTPPTFIPIPYPNLALGCMGIPNAWNILLMGMPAHNLLTVVPLTNGDNAGLELGMVSETVMGSSRHITCVPNVLFKCIPATRLTSMTEQNTINSVGMRIVPSQFKVLLLGAGSGKGAEEEGAAEGEVAAGEGGGAGEGGEGGEAGEGTEGGKASEAKSAKRAQLKRNNATGKQREKEVEAELKSEGHDVVGTQVSAKTPQSRRVIDILIKDGDTNEVRAIEVKSGGATRSATQVAKDTAMEKDGAQLVGKNAPGEDGYQGPMKIPTEVRH